MTIFAIYGIYEVVYYDVITGSPGDFISNPRVRRSVRTRHRALRRHRERQFVPAEQISVGGLNIQRLKALTGEPSMYAMSIFPFWIYFNATSRMRWPVWIIGASLVMSTSSTVLIGYAAYAVIRMRKLGINPIKTLIFLGVLCIIAFLPQDYIANL